MIEVQLNSVELPDFGPPTVEPVVALDVYAARIEATSARARQAGYDALVVYGDREHGANLAYLTGFDPRFEEAMLILVPGRTPAVLVGNEGWGYADISPIELRKVLYQSFSLLAQARDKSKPLGEILVDEGIGEGSRVGVAGWKYFGEQEATNPRQQLEVPSYIADTLREVDRLVAPYFRAIAEWYGTLGIGVTGGQLYEIIDRHLGDPFFGIALNPGHQIHLDEWVNSPIFAGSTVELKSGMALQVDIIPATGGDYFTTNIEDGIALADEEMREGFARKFPEAWNRIQARRSFMADNLGIRLKPEVLPFSNIPAYLPPFLLRPDRVMTVAGVR